MKVILDKIQYKRLNFSFKAIGEFSEGIHLITGAVGSGKSTLALLIAGYLQPESGNVRRNGIQSMQLSLQFPEYHLTGLTVSDECISWGCNPKSILGLCNLMGKENVSPFSLSRGELKKIHLTCILQKQYDLLLLDEPFSALDCQEKIELCTQLYGHKKGITIIFTHEQTILPKVDYIWELLDGMLYFRGAPPSAIEQWQGAPSLIKKLVKSGMTPRNVSYDEIKEAVCRI
ncbi:MAG: ATP-binding cassette domain-containing protein [Methanoregulaceae archaeon]